MCNGNRTHVCRECGGGGTADVQLFILALDSGSSQLRGYWHPACFKKVQQDIIAATRTWVLNSESRHAGLLAKRLARSRLSGGKCQTGSPFRVTVHKSVGGPRSSAGRGDHGVGVVRIVGGIGLAVLAGITRTTSLHPCRVPAFSGTLLPLDRAPLCRAPAQRGVGASGGPIFGQSSGEGAPGPPFDCSRPRKQPA